MKFLVCAFALLCCLAGPLHAQTAQDMKNAAPEHRKGETEEQKGKRLLDEMVKALGGDAWLNKRTMYREGQTAPFFRGQPSGLVTQFVEYTKFTQGTTPDVQRVEFLTWRGVIMPGKKRD